MPNSKIKLIIFDWDDVFTRGSTEGYFKCYHQTLNELNVKLSPEEEKKRIFAKWGQPHREELRELLKEHPEFLDEACKIYENHLFGDTFVNCLKIIPGAKELVTRLQNQYILSVATGLNPTILNERVIPKFGIPDVFSQVVSAYDIDDPTKAKPHPHMAEHILQTQNILPSEAVLVGDAKNDVLMAQAAHITPIVVLSGHLNAEQAEELGVKYIIPDVTHIEGVLEALK